MYCDFLGRAGDEIFNQMAKWQAMSAGVLKMPLVLRISVGNKYGAQHSQDWSAFVAHVPGLKVYYPVTPYDAKGMLNLALAGSDPVVFFESQKIYGIGEYFVKDGVPEGYYEIEEGEPIVRKEGMDITIITLGPVLYTALDAAKEIQEKYGISTEVIDLRFVNPLNYDILAESVRKTGKVVLCTDSVERSSFMSEVAANLSTICFDDLDAPVSIVGSRNWITPAAEMEADYFPQKEWIIDTIHERIIPLQGHQVSTNRTIQEMTRRHRNGV
jgi:2-oxoisovalerate dehydrogenase E1 component